ncbi:hypothetical protein [Sinomonas atrocyanea]|uniref:hypothetical protein n=1 Tax=Sinomonas atrocyanea TaxID=37927 RepID=UPI0027863C50|nr:hypothetical protein [Sinomonas atrocyanea]MDQ0259083.1 hypothetical protein [Sinomonas atrocyanea]MDR6622615.1 hypothetical protein [Sinomonas atrocyanea]
MPSQRQISVRRAPKYVPFLVAGGLLGAIAAAVTSFAEPAPQNYTQGSVFGYFMVLFAAGGVLLGGLTALILDRVSLRRAERATLEEVEEPTEAPSAPAAEGSRAHDGGHSPSSADAPAAPGTSSTGEDGPEAGATPAP